MSKKQRKKLSDAEWELMQAVWQFSRPVTVREVHDRLYPNGEKAYTTVQTTMNVLADKGFLKREKRGPVNFYSPLISHDEALKLETRSLVSRIFDGSFGALAAYLIKSGQLSDSDIEEIKRLIDHYEQKS